MNDINIVFACDKNYIIFLATAIASILKNADREDNFNFYVLDGGIPKADQDKIIMLQSIKDFSIQFISMDLKKELEKCYVPPDRYFTKAVYYRFFIADILNKLDKVLYLDVDIIVQSSLNELYAIDISNDYIVACPDSFESTCVQAILKFELYGHSYFNSGVLLMNLKKWREDKISEQLLAITHKMKDKLGIVDQDVLNIFFCNNYKKLGFEYNCDAASALKNPNVKIIHYMCGNKFDHESSYLLHEYVALTPFKYFDVKNKQRYSLKKTIKLLLKKLIHKLVSHKRLGTVLVRIASYIVREKEELGEVAEWKRFVELEPFIAGAIKYHSPDLKVLNGSFKGLQYPKSIACGSTLFPKILGSYEQELAEVVQKIIAAKPQTIINIGCVDGYYATGLAMSCPNALVLAFDIDAEARRACLEMAIINNVEKRIVIAGECTEQSLLAISATNGGTFICDCGGAEKKLLTKKVFEHFNNFSFLVEIHDRFDLEISTYIRHAAENTHTIISISSCSDTYKAVNYTYEELVEYSKPMKKILLAEKRLENATWFYFVPKMK